MLKKTVSKEDMESYISLALIKCSSSLGIKMSQNDILTLSEDLLDVYQYDSIEDIIYALKKGRQGMYGFGHNSRGSLNMLVIREWMSNVLEEKAAAREKDLEKYKEKNDKYIEVDYEAFKKNLVEKKKGKTQAEKDQEYNNFKMKYYNKKK